MNIEIKRLKIDLQKCREFNLSLANENFRLWKELDRLNSPLAKEREARISLKFDQASREFSSSKAIKDMEKRSKAKPIAD